MSAVEVLVYLSSDDERVKRCVDNILKYTPNACNVHFWGDHISNASARYVKKFCIRVGPIGKRAITLTNAHRVVGYNPLMLQALREAKARYIILSNDNVVVTEGWISKMMVCLRSEASLGIVCPFTCVGVRQNLFSTLPTNVSSEEIAAKLSQISRREYPRITSADTCILVKKEALDKVHFFQPNTNIESDLCHTIRRLGFNVAIADDVFVYCDRTYVAPLSKEDSTFYGSNPLGRFRQSMLQGKPLDKDVPSRRPPRKYPNKKQLNTIKLENSSIRIYSPSDTDLKYGKWWGDHWVRENLYEAFERQGWARSQEDKVDFSLLLKGSNYVESKAVKSAVWIYSHPNDDLERFLSPNFNFVYTLSEKHADQIRDKRPDVKVLLPATSKIYCPREGPPKYDILIVGNSAKPERIKAVKYLIGKGYNIRIVGATWEKLINKKYIIAPYWDNEKYSELFNQAKITIYVHHEDMRQLDFVAVRILDVIACSDCFVISDKNDGLNKLGLDVPQYTDFEDLEQIIEKYLNDSQICINKMQKWRQHITENHTFERRVGQIISDVATNTNAIAVVPKVSFVKLPNNKKVTVFLSKVHSLCYDMNIKFSQGMVEAFRELGFDSQLVHDPNVVNAVQSGIVFCAAPSFQENLTRQPGVKYIMYQSEQCPVEDVYCERAERFWKESISQQLPFYDIIFEPCERQIEFLNHQGYNNVVQFRVGYHKFFELNRTDRIAYDIVYVAHPTGELQRRWFILETLKEFCTDNGLSYNFPQLNRAGRYDYITGEQYADMLFAGKIFLNLHFSRIRYFEYHKLIVDSFCNARFVISEPITHLSPFKADKHLVMCKVQEMPEKILYYTKREKERQQIAQDAYKFVKDEFTLVGNLKKALEEVEIL